jgi:DNA-binding response OmpR family regulator
MQDLTEAYRRGVEPLLDGLRSALPDIRAGNSEAIARARGLSHQLKGSGTSFGHPEITALAAAVLDTEDSDLAEALDPLVAALDEVVDAGHPAQRILVVDDDPLIRMIVAKTLDNDRRELVMAGSMQEARSSIDATIDLVLLDLLLPDGDGRQFLSHILADQETGHIPVVMLSGSGSEAVRLAAMDAGATAFVEKPFHPVALSGLVDDLLEPHANEATEPPAPPSSPEEGPSSVTVLLAEDDELVAALVSDRLVRDGYTIRHEVDGESAYVEALQSPPDVVILDVMMPKMNGFEVLGRLRSTPETAQVPIIMLTGRGREEDVVRGFELGATDYIVKPFSPAELAVRVRRHTSAP